MDEIEAITIGSYVIATKYDDGDPGDPWAVGYYLGPTENGRHLVGDEDGKSYYAKGYGRIRAGLREDVGRWLIANCELLERAPPGMINLWGMLGKTAFDDLGGRETKSFNDDEPPPPQETV